MRGATNARLRPPPRRGWVLALVVAATFSYSAVLICRSSFIVEGRRWFCLFDDALITLRYAENIARGHGPVWNIGERVEGVSSPLWTLLLVPFHWLGLGKSGVCLAVQCLSALSMVYLVWATWRLASVFRLPLSARVIAIASAGLSYTAQYFAVTGMETTLFAAAFTHFVAAMLGEFRFAKGGGNCTRRRLCTATAGHGSAARGDWRRGSVDERP